jgi:hypothetical protein
MERVSEDVCRGLDCAISGDTASVSDISRDLMEIEVLLREFAHDPSRVRKWNDQADDHMMAREFSFGRVVDRLRQALGEEQGMVLPDKMEYAAHSAGLHPTPTGRRAYAWVAESDSDGHLQENLTDLLEHIKRNIHAALDLIEAAPEDQSVLKFVDEGTGTMAVDPPPSLDAWADVNNVLFMRQLEMRERLSPLGIEFLPRSPRKTGESFFQVRPSGEADEH